MSDGIALIVRHGECAGLRMPCVEDHCNCWNKARYTLEAIRDLPRSAFDCVAHLDANPDMARRVWLHVIDELLLA